MFDNIIERYKLYGKIIIYLRKSREEMINGFGGGVEFTLERHEEILQSWALNNLGYKIPEENIFREVGSGETIADRPVMINILKLIKNNEISGVLIVEPQRLSRGELKDCGEIIESFELTDTKALTPQKVYDLSDKYDKKMFRDELLRGNEYLEYTKEILARGRHLSVSQGKFVGSKTPYGYDKEKLKDTKGFKLVQNEDAETVKLMFSMYIDGYTPYQIAAHLRNINANKREYAEWDHLAVKKVLKNPVYYGYLTWQNRKSTKMFINGKVKNVRVQSEHPKLYKGLHTPIVSEEIFFKAQDIIKNRSIPRTKSSYETHNPLAGIVKCGKCGRSMARQAHPGETQTIRKYELDKYELFQFINDYKTKNKITHKDIYTALGVPNYCVYDWFKNPERFYPNGVFKDYWFELKKVLKIKANKFDKAITEFIDIPKPDTLACIYHNCNNTSSNLYLVENMILKVIEERLKDFNNYLDNYEIEYIKELESNEKVLNKIEKEINDLKKELKTALRNYNREDYSREEYLDIKSDITKELAELEAKRESLTVGKEDKVIIIKKSVPILSACIKNYPTLNPSEKNKLLKTILSEVYYTKNGKGTEFNIEPKFKI